MKKFKIEETEFTFSASDLEKALKEAQRELGMKKSVYPRWIRQDKITPERAKIQIHGSELVVKILTEIKEGKKELPKQLSIFENF